MGVDSVPFQSAGQRTEHYIPGAYSRTNYVKSAGGGVSANRAVFIGESKGGKPNTLYWFYSPSEAIDTLRSGPLLEAVLCAFSPGGDLVPQMVGAMRTNPGTQSSRTLKASTTDVILVKAWDWGLHTNQLKMKLEAGTAAGSKKVTLSFLGSESAIDNIVRPSIEIQYVGAGSAATMSISKTALTTTVTGADDSLNVDFASFPTIEDLVNYINDHSAYTCVAKTGDLTQKSAHLDGVTGQAIKATSYVAYSNLQAIIEAIAKNPYAYSAAFVDAAPTRVVPDVDTDWVYFSGGSHGACTVTEYTASLSALENEDVQIIGSSATDEAVHILIRNHCINMSSVEGRKERMFLVGGAAGETVDQAIARAKNLATDTGSLAYPGFVHYDFSDYSVKKTYSPAMYAAKLIGQEVALAINEPMTNKSVDILSWEADLKKGDLVKLIQAGVTAGGKSQDNRLATIRSLTTYQGNELQRCERSMRRESNYMSRDLREAISKSVGSAGDDSSGGTEEAIFWTKVKAWHGEGLIVKADDGSLAWGLVIRRSGSATYIEYHTYLTAPKNFFFITANQHVYEGSTESVSV